jgi:hypothetical protein
VPDVNHDGKLDLVVAGFGSPLQVFLGGRHFPESDFRSERFSTAEVLLSMTSMVTESQTWLQ